MNECMVCGYIYDTVVGDADNGLEAGTVEQEIERRVGRRWETAKNIEYRTPNKE